MQRRPLLGFDRAAPFESEPYELPVPPLAHGVRLPLAQGFFGPEYAAEVKLLATAGLLDDEDGE